MTVSNRIHDASRSGAAILSRIGMTSGRLSLSSERWHRLCGRWQCNQCQYLCLSEPIHFSDECISKAVRDRISIRRTPVPIAQSVFFCVDQVNVILSWGRNLLLCLPRNLHFEVHQALCLPQNLHFETLRFTKCCACHEICTSRFTKRCACHEICTSRFTKRCAYNEICTSRLPSAAPARNLHFEVHQALCLPRNLHFEVHNARRLPRNLRIEGHRVLCLPRNLQTSHMSKSHDSLHLSRNLSSSTITTMSKVLHLPRKLHFEAKQLLAPVTRSRLWSTKTRGFRCACHEK